MSRIALEHGATIDKFVGDAILIFFGDPETPGGARGREGLRADGAGDARAGGGVACRRHRAAAQLPHGVHTDFCTVGNFGSEDRLDYTIIGRGVNIAARLESLAEPGGILISYETQAHVADEIDCEAQGEVSVRGLAYPVATFRVVGPRRAAVEEAPPPGLDALARADPAALTEAEPEAAVVRLRAALEQFDARPRRPDAAE